jgi:hypothetical protein
LINYINPVYNPASGPFVKRSADMITDVIIHHTDGPSDQTPLQIDAFERSRGDIYMPYGRLIGPDGKAYTGRPDLVESAASYGRNPVSIAVCVIGDFQDAEPTDAAWTTLCEVVLDLHKRYLSIVRTYGHRDIEDMFYSSDPNKAADFGTLCPGNRLEARLPELRDYVQRYK